MRAIVGLVASLLLASALAALAPAYAQSADCVRHALGCLQWKFEYTYFSPDSRYMYFTYRYSAAVDARSSRDIELTSRIVARVALEENRTEVFKADCRYDYGNPSVSPDGRYFVVSVTDRIQHDAEGPLQFIELNDLRGGQALGENSTRRIAIEENNSKLYFDPFFSRDGRTLYFVRISRGFSILIFAHDIASGAVNHVFPTIIRRRVANHPERTLPPREIMHLLADADQSIRYLARPEFHNRADEIVFYGRFPGPDAEKRLLEPLARRTGFNVAQLRATILVYSINFGTKRLDLHPLSEKLDHRKLGIGAFRLVPGKGIYFLNGHYKHPGVDRTVYHCDETRHELVPFDSVDHDGHQWFDISPDLRWIAYTHAEGFSATIAGTQRRLERSWMVVKDRTTGRKLTIDLAAMQPDLLDRYSCNKP